MPVQSRGSAKIYYEVTPGGSSQWITLINGHTRPISDFRSLSRYLGERGINVLAVDNRGSGKTQAPLPFTKQEMLADIESIWASEGVTKTAVLGISLGGILAQALTLSHPKQVERLFLISTAPEQKFISGPALVLSDDPEETRQRLGRYFSPGFHEKNPVFVKALIRETSKTFLSPDLKERSEAQKLALKGFSFVEDLKNIRCPVHILHGEADEVMSVDAARTFKKLMPDAELTLLPGVGHLILAENSRFLFDWILDRLTNNRPETEALR